MCVQGEEIPLIDAISTAKARGQVEKWLLELETEMKKSIRSQILLCSTAHSVEEEQQWVTKWPEQCVSHTQQQQKKPCQLE